MHTLFKTYCSQCKGVSKVEVVRHDVRLIIVLIAIILVEFLALLVTNVK